MNKDMAPPVAQPKKRKRLAWILTGILLGVCAWAYVVTHPLVFNESFFEHKHCIVQTGLALVMYAEENNGQFPFHTNGYGDALLLLLRDQLVHAACLTGPGYDPSVFDRALTNYTDIPEEECGRVYIQGLSDTNSPDIAILFDKLPTPGGDHCHGPRRIIAPLCREVVLIGGTRRLIRERDWPQFAQKQIELLVEAGFTREHAERLYAEKPKQAKLLWTKPN